MKSAKIMTTGENIWITSREKKGDLVEPEPKSCQRVVGRDGESKGEKLGGLANTTTPPQS